MPTTLLRPNYPPQTPLPANNNSRVAGTPIALQQTNTPPPSIANQTPTPPKKQDNTTAWLLGLGGLALTATIGGIFWWKAHQKKSSASPSAQTVIGLVDPIKKADFTGIQPKRTVAEVQALCHSVMQVGNGSLACQTMSCINSIRLYKQLAETEAGFDSSYLSNVIAFLKHGNNETLKIKAFEFFKALFPSEYGQFLANNRINTQHETNFQTILMPHFLSQYVFNTLGGSTATFSEIHKKDMATMLSNLCTGNVGLLGGAGWRGGHQVSLVGIHEVEQGCIDQVIRQLRENNQPDPDLLNKINLLIYDQLQTSEPFGHISLKEIFGSTKEDKWFDLRVFAKQEMLHRPLEKQINNPDQFYHDITSYSFHQRLMREGDAIFKPS